MSNVKTPVKELAQGKWFHILSGLGIAESFLKDKHGPCPLCGGKDRYRWDDKQGRGTYYCQCGPGDGIQLLMKFHNWSFPETANRIEELLEGPAPRSQSSKPGEQKNPMDVIEKIIAGTNLIQPGDPAHEYLTGRGLTKIPDALGYHSALYEAETGKSYQGMIARIQDSKGETVSLHRTFLKDGRKAPISSPRKILTPAGTVNGAAIRLYPAGNLVGVAEGIESAIAAHEQFNVPVWSVINANGLKTFKPPEGLEIVLIFSDNDKNYCGQAAAYALANKLILEGFHPDIYIPSRPGTDWLDELLTKKERAA